MDDNFALAGLQSVQTSDTSCEYSLARNRPRDKGRIEPCIIRNGAVMLEVERRDDGLADHRRAIRFGAQMHAASAVVTQIQLGKCRLIAADTRRLGTTLLL
jgi:hypothetical protein